MKAHKRGDYIVARCKGRLFIFSTITNEYYIRPIKPTVAADFTIEEINSFMSQTISILEDAAYGNN